MASNHDPVRLRRRATKDGGASLYLDIYTDGVRRYEYLHLYLLPDTRANKAKNAETLALAEAVRAKRLVEVRNNRYGFNDAAVGDVKMYDYFARCLAKRKAFGGQRWRHWRNVLLVLRCYERREGLMLRHIAGTFATIAAANFFEIPCFPRFISLKIWLFFCSKNAANSVFCSMFRKFFKSSMR